MKLFELYADLSLDASNFNSGITKATKAGNTLAGTLKGGIGGATKFVGNQISATTVMLGNLMTDVTHKGADIGRQIISTGFDYNRQMEMYTTNFTTMLDGSAAAAEKLTGDLEDMAAATPFAMTDLADATQTLLQFGQDSESVLGTLQSLGDIAMGDSNKLQSLTLAFAQASSSGKLMGQDLMQMINAGFNPLQTIVDKTGASMADLKEFMSNGKASDVLKKQMQKATEEVARMGDEASDGAKMLVQMAEDGAISAELLGQIFNIETSPGGKFYKAMENASKTFNGMVSTLEDDTSALMGKVMEPAFDFMTDTLLPKAISVIGELDKAYDLGGLTGMASKATEILTETLGTWGTVAFDAGSGLLAEVLTGLTGDTVNKEEIKEFFTDLGNDGSHALNVIVTTGSGLLKGIYGGLTGDAVGKSEIVAFFSDLWENSAARADILVSTANDLLGGIYTGLTGQEMTRQNIISTIQGLFSGGISEMETFRTNAAGLLSGIATAITGDETSATDVGQAIGKAFSAGHKSINTIKTEAGKLLGTIYETITGQEATAENIGKTIGGVFNSGVEAATNVLTTATTFFTDLNESLGNPDASIGQKIAGVFGAGSDAMIHLLNDAGSFMSDLYAAITGDVAGASNIQGWVDNLFRTGEEVEAQNAEEGARNDTNTTFENLALREARSANEVNDMLVSLANEGVYGFGESFRDIWNPLYMQAVMSGNTQDEEYQKLASQIVAAYDELHSGNTAKQEEALATFNDMFQGFGDLEMGYGMEATEAEGFEWEGFKESVNELNSTNSDVAGAIDLLNAVVAEMATAASEMRSAAITLANKKLEFFVDGRSMSRSLAPYNSEFMAVAYSDD